MMHEYVTGIGLSPTIIHAAYRHNAATVHAGGLALLRGSLATVPVPDQQFDEVPKFAHKYELL